LTDCYTKSPFLLAFFATYVKGLFIVYLVEFFKGASLFDLSGLGDFLEQKLQCKVDVVSQRAVREEIKSSVYEDLVAV